MASNPKEISLDKLVYRFESAITLLKKREVTMQELSERMGFSAGFLSRYKKPQLYALNPAAYDDVFEVIDRLLLEKFNQKWNKNNEEYELIHNETAPLLNQNTFNRKLLGLNGSWQGFSWNKEKTDFSSIYPTDTPTDYFNIFKMQISGEGDVDCFLEKTKMKGEISFITLKKIVINLKSEGRWLTILGQIPLRDDLAAVNDITVAYTDSGDNFLKCGVAIINRIDNEREIKPGALRNEDLDDISEFEKKYLAGKQIKADEWNFLIK